MRETSYRHREPCRDGTLANLIAGVCKILQKLAIENWRMALGQVGDTDPLYKQLRKLTSSVTVSPNIPGGTYGAATIELSAFAQLVYHLNPDFVDRRLTFTGQPLTPEKARLWLTSADEELAHRLGASPAMVVAEVRGLNLSALDHWLSECRDSLAQMCGPTATTNGPQTHSGSASYHTPSCGENDGLAGFLHVMGMPELMNEVRLDTSDSAKVARCYACGLRDLRIVVPVATRVGDLRCLAHEFGHAWYFRETELLESPPWSLEPLAAQESVAFAFEFCSAMHANSNTGWSPVAGSLKKEALDSVVMAREELWCHGRSSDGVPLPMDNALATYVAQPWVALDYALGRLTGVASSIAFEENGPGRVRDALRSALIEPGPKMSWAQRFREYCTLLGLDGRVPLPPLARS